MANIVSETVGAILTALGWDGTAFRAFLVNADGRLQVDVVDWVPALHAATHEDGGADEISVEGLSGILADDQDAGALRGSEVHDAAPLPDEILVWDDVAGWWEHAPLPAPPAHAASHQNGGADEVDVTGLSGALADDQPPAAHLLAGAKHTADSLADLNLLVNDATLDDSGDPRDPNAHAASHQNAGADEVSVEGLSGDLADAQDAKAHLLGSATHTVDTLANLNLKISDANVDDDGDPRDPNAHAASHQNAGADEISVLDLSGLLADAQTPLGHHASHENGGADEISLTGLSGMGKAIEFIIDGGGAEIALGEHGHLAIPVACDIQSVTMYADQVGSIVVDIWNDSYANFPPTDADSITAAAPPTITAAQKSYDGTLTDWTTLLPAGTAIAYNVDSVTDIERVTICLHARTH